jgi:Ser/Thr protein kinase RdoA (MazF antagonist)
MAYIDFNAIVRSAWDAYDSSRKLLHIEDISAKVSTNHVYRMNLSDKTSIVAKLSYFGRYEHFVEDHSIINSLSNNLPNPFEDVLSRSLMKGSELFVYRHKEGPADVWVVFYRPIKTRHKLPKRLNEEQIVTFGNQMGQFHAACEKVRHTLPPSSKTLMVDIDDLLVYLGTDEGRFEHFMYRDLIIEHAEKFKQNFAHLGADKLTRIPVFMDWNIGNFSVTKTFRLYSRWDYDWFRGSSRMLDFYFFARVVSDIGDRTMFTYNVDILMHERFKLFLRSYHRVNPLSEQEILFLKEAYRFFLLTYVVKYGRFFFHELFANTLQKETFETHLPGLDDQFDASCLMDILN